MSAMALFSSARERRLWLWTLAVVVAIYATLGLAQTLTGALYVEGLLDNAFFLVLLLLVATVVAQGVNVRPRGAEIAVALGITAVYLLVFLRITSSAERTHLFEYGVVGVFIYEAARRARRVAVVRSRCRPYSPSWRRRHWACSTNASRRFCRAACSTHSISWSTCWRARWRWVRASRWHGHGDGITAPRGAR